MAVEPTMKANVGAAIMLTSGASGPVNALLSLRALKSLAMLIHARRTRTKMAVEPTTKANVGAAIMLTSGASGPVNALLSLRALKSLAMLIHAFVLLLLLPFRGRKRCMTTSPSMMSSSLSSGCSDKGHNKEEKLHDKKGKTVARVPARIVPWKSSSAVVVDQEVAARRALAIRRVVQDDNDGESVREFSLFVTSRGDTMFTQSWTPVSFKIR
ncbi:unnamed protein product [Ilex paraguariensis]|uniref:Uncharacterized protein n=1 Tax=Ilex paraguariensis TaxID=185542 RepID=A0ABC8UGG9_9AQUA